MSIFINFKYYSLHEYYSELFGWFKLSPSPRRGQATIPKRLREKYGIKNKVIFEENDCGLFLKPVLSPEDLMGSLKHMPKAKQPANC